MFSAQRARRYTAMVSLLVRRPHYLARILLRIRHHECDALLAIVLGSLFARPAHEHALTALFAEVVALEVDRTPSIDTVMRNDAPSVHLLSAYLRTPVCLDYLRTAIGATIELVADLGNVSLDPDLATVYQDWARMQPAARMPLVVSAVEAASYTEVQNLSRRRHGYLVRVARHCLFDIFGARGCIPAGLTAISASMLAALGRRFPEADEAKRYSLVGSLFFLRFVNAALTTPSHYGLLDAPPAGVVKTNLKLVARLMQRMSNYAGKQPAEWPPDVRQFIADNIADFHTFLVALTTTPAAPEAGLPPQPPPPRRALSAATPMVARQADGRRRLVGTGDSSSGGGGPSAQSPHIADVDRGIGEPATAPDSPPARPAPRAGSEPPPAGSATPRRGSWGQRPSLGAPAADLAPALAQLAAATAHEPSHSPSNCLSSAGASVQSMFDMGHAMDDRSGDRRPSRTGPFGDVTLPLNDLYLLQKYLIMYEDAWAPGEPDGQQQQQQGQAPGAHSPMARCLAALGPAPPLVQASNNHTTRIPLE